MSWLKAKDWATGVEYSSLFHSGLRTISLRPRDRRARASSNSSSMESSWSGGASSIASLSSRLLRRSSTRTRHPSPSVSTSTDSSPATPSRTPIVARPRPSSMFVRPTKEMQDAWSSRECFFDVEDYPKSPEEGRVRAEYLLPPIELDAVRSSAGSRPFFVNLGEMDAMGEESFLSLSNSPDEFLQHPIPRRERPVSVQTMSVPSRQSSLHYRTRRDWGDCAWMLEESSPELNVYDPWGEEEEEEEEEEEIRLDDERDWRQFHVNWVRNIR